MSENNAAYGRILLSEAQTTRNHIQKRPSSIPLSQVLASFFIYSCESALSHHSLAFYFLREATTLYLLLDVNAAAQHSLQHVLSDRLFWILLVSERSHAVRYRKPVTLQLTAASPALDQDSELAGFRNLAELFRPLSTSFIAALNQEEHHLANVPTFLDHVETAINLAIDHTVIFRSEQKANLRVTQLWLRIILWQLRLRLGHLAEDALSKSMTYQYPLEVAKELTMSTRDLPIESMKMHGVGLTEKIFDVSCAMVDVLARVPLSGPDRQATGITPEESLRYLQQLIATLMGGKTYGSLLSKHIHQTLPRNSPSAEPN